MSQIVEQLTKAAELEKKAYLDYVKSFASSGISTLVKGGVGFDKAAHIMKEACEKDSKVIQLGFNVQVFEKTAEYVAKLEDQVLGLQKVAEEYEHKEEISTSEPLTKLASIGFTEEEIEHMSSLPENLLEKVASSAGNSKPWELGGGAGIAREKTDPLLEFILG